MDDFESVADAVQSGDVEGLAALALALAAEVDNPENSATSKSMCGRTLLETLKQLRELAPPAEKEDKLDELSDRRARRRGSAA